MLHGALMRSPETLRARELRRNMSGTERRVWYRLRRKQVDGFRFRRQLPVGPYFVDFVCLSARLAVEVDGFGHDEERDQRKTAYLESQGFRVLRVAASDTDRELDAVIEMIWEELCSPLPDPPQQVGRGS